MMYEDVLSSILLIVAVAVCSLDDMKKIQVKSIVILVVTSLITYLLYAICFSIGLKIDVVQSPRVFEFFMSFASLCWRLSIICQTGISILRCSKVYFTNDQTKKIFVITLFSIHFIVSVIGSAGWVTNFLMYYGTKSNQFGTVADVVYAAVTCFIDSITFMMIQYKIISVKSQVGELLN